MSSELAIERQNGGTGQRAQPEVFSPIHKHGDFVYERIKINRRNVWLVRFKAVPFEHQLGYEEVFRRPDEVRHNIRPGVEVTSVKPVRGKDAGKEIAIATREMRRGVLVTGMVVVNEEYRKKGIATHLAEDAIFRLQPRAVTGRARRWEVPRTYERVEYQGERVVPVVSPIDTGGRLPGEAQRQLVIVLTPKEREGLDLEKGLYSPGIFPIITDLRSFTPPRNNPEGTRIFNVLNEMGVYPARAFRYWGLTDQDVLKRAKATYRPTEVVIMPRSRSLLDRLIAALSGIVFAPPALKRL